MAYLWLTGMLDRSSYSKGKRQRLADLYGPSALFMPPLLTTTPSRQQQALKPPAATRLVSDGATNPTQRSATCPRDLPLLVRLA
jgi:hypothetical protein